MHVTFSTIVHCKEEDRKQEHKEDKTFQKKMDDSNSYRKIDWLIGIDNTYRLTTRFNLIKSLKLSSNDKIIIIIAKGGSGASNHYWREEDKDCVGSIKLIKGLEVTLSNKTSTNSD